MTAAGEYFLSRLQFGVHVFEGEDAVDLMRWLGTQTGEWIDVKVRLGKKDQLPCRLIAWRLPKELASQRRMKLRQSILKKRACGYRPTNGR